MKKRSLFLVALTAISFQTFGAALQTTGWRWINDDGDQMTATPMTEEDCTPVTITESKTLRLRVRVDNPYKGDGDNVSTTGLGYGAKETVYLQYADNPESPVFSTDTDFAIKGDNECFTALGSVEYFDFATSQWESDGTPTESKDVVYNSLNAGDRQTIFTPGIIMASSQTVTVPHATYTEIEYCITPTENVVNGTYYFLGGTSGMILHPGASKLETFPELTIDFTPTGISKSNVEAVKVLASSASFEISSLPQGIVKITIYNSIGEVAKSVKANAIDGAISIPASSLAKGLYIVAIQTVNGTIQKKNLLK